MEKTCTQCGETKERRWRQDRGHWEYFCRSCRAARTKQYNASRYRKGVHEVSHEARACKDCGLIKDADEFNINTLSPDGRVVRCKPCQRINDVSRRHGISPEEYLSLMDRANWCCEICGSDGSEYERGLCIDHDHACCPNSGRSCGRCIRGVLCVGCNAGLGNFREDKDKLVNAVEYLNRVKE